MKKFYLIISMALACCTFKANAQGSFRQAITPEMELNLQLAQSGLGLLSPGNYFLKLWENGYDTQNATFKLVKAQ